MRRGQSPHQRRTGPMLASARCGAKTRCGTPCRAPAVSGKCRCRMHGGAHGSGAPRGNRNALRHGLYTAESLARRRRVNRLLRDGASLLRRFEKRAGRAPGRVPHHSEQHPDEARRLPRDGPPRRRFDNG